MGLIKWAAINAAVKEAVAHAAPESQIAVLTVVDAIKRAAINADAEADATVSNLRGEIKHLHLLLATKHTAAADHDARAAANEAAATNPPRSTDGRRRTSAYCFSWRQSKQPQQLKCTCQVTTTR
jgi:hypothetical protein